jgi:predicted ATP-grasp superfamily ATP-dependent carboligase
VTAVDAFGDRDLREVADVIVARGAPGRRYGPRQMAMAAATVPAALVAYTSNFENYPAAVSQLASGRTLLGNSAETLSRVRNPTAVMRVLRRNGLPSLESRTRAPAPSSLHHRWLIKPLRSGGGHGVARWSPGKPVPRGRYLQQWMAGVVGSASFVANGSEAVVLGLSLQLVGEADFAALPYRYCGSIVGGTPLALFSRQTELHQLAQTIATVLTREFHLIGLNGIDFMARRGVPYITEVNPRYSASMELFERAGGGSMFTLHRAACAGELPAPIPPDLAVQGKAIVFARHQVQVGGTSEWPARKWVADLPHPGEQIPQGRPVCTVFARARTVELCRRLLRERAAAVYRAVRSRRGRAA